MLLAAPLDLHLKPFGKGIYYRDSYTVQPAGNFVAASTELGTGVKHRQRNLDAGLLYLRVFVNRIAPAIVLYGDGAVLV